MSDSPIGEPAFTGIYWDHTADGVYRCVQCEAHLFDSRDKRDWGDGWPRFTTPITPDVLVEGPAEGPDGERIDVSCAACGAHLGSGPTSQAGQDEPCYRIDSGSLDFTGRVP